MQKRSTATKPAKRKPAKRAARRGGKPTGKPDPDKQGDQADYRVGPGCPPREYQWRPGQSGNPQGRPPGKTYIRQHILEYLSLTRTELAKAKKNKGLTLSQLAAIKVCEQVQQGVPRRGITALLKLLMEYDDGKPVQPLRMDTEGIMSPEECEEVRRAMRKQERIDAHERRDTP